MRKEETSSDVGEHLSTFSLASYCDFNPEAKDPGPEAYVPLRGPEIGTYIDFVEPHSKLVLI